MANQRSVKKDFLPVGAITAILQKRPAFDLPCNHSAFVVLHRFLGCIKFPFWRDMALSTDTPPASSFCVIPAMTNKLVILIFLVPLNSAHTGQVESNFQHPCMNRKPIRRWVLVIPFSVRFYVGAT